MDNSERPRHFENLRIVAPVVMLNHNKLFISSSHAECRGADPRNGVLNLLKPSGYFKYHQV